MRLDIAVRFIPSLFVTGRSILSFAGILQAIETKNGGFGAVLAVQAVQGEGPLRPLMESDRWPI